MGNTQQVPRGAPYNVRLAFYREVLAAIEKEEIEEMKTLSPGFVRLFFYWLQNVIAFPEGVIRAIWHGVFALVFLPFGLCAMKRSSVHQQQGATNETAVVEKGETAPPAEANATTAQNNCLVATWVHHSNVAWLYVDSLLFTVGRNIICPWNPIWLYNLYTPINRPPPPPKPSRGLCDCEDCCRIECANFCARLVDAMTHVWLRLQRTLYCAIGCHEACAPELILGPLACCPHVQCAPPFWSLEARLARWSEERAAAQDAATLAFYNKVYGVDTYAEACRNAYAAYRNAPTARVVAAGAVAAPEAMEMGARKPAEPAAAAGGERAQLLAGKQTTDAASRCLVQ